MKTKLFFLLVSCFLSLLLRGQEDPYTAIGKAGEIKTLTLSNGRYAEFFDNDTLRQIGSVLFNTKTNEIEYIIPEEDLEKIRIARRDREVSRFFAVDPLTAKYPYYTPYSFSGNKVIHAIELEGAEELVVSNLKMNARPIVYINNDSELQNYIMFVIPSGVHGKATTITRPVTRGEKITYSGSLNRRGSNLYQPDVEKPESEKDANGQWISITMSRGKNSANNAIVTTSPANTTETSIINDFSTTTDAFQTINFQIANGATSLNIDYSDGGNHLNKFVFSDSKGTALSPAGGYEGIGTAVLNIPSGVTNISLTVTGKPNETFDTWSVTVTSSGPDASATNVSGVSINPKKEKNGLSMITTPITVKKDVESTQQNPINK